MAENYSYQEAVYNGTRPPLKVMYYDGKTLTHITTLCSAVTISGDISQAFRKCELDLTNTLNGMTQAFAIDLSHEIRVMVGNAEIFRGPLFVYNVDDRGGAQAVAYDYNYYLTVNKDSEKFVGKTASQIIRSLCSKYGISAGSLPDTQYVIPRMILRDKTLFDMMVIALTETEKSTGRKYSLVNQWGKLYLLERKKAIKRVVFENQRTLLSSSYAKSNENRRTSVKVVGNTDAVPIAGTATNDDSVRAYGTMQHYEIVQDATTQAQLNAMARQLLTEYDKTDEEFSIEALGLYDVISGTAVVVNERMANLYGAFYVQQDTHKFDASGLHTMSLKLSRTLDIPREDYEEPQETTSSTSTGTADLSAQLSGKSYQSGFIGTAYDPRLGGINADGNPDYTATSTKWAYNRTIAVAPKVIPYGSVVHVIVPGAPEFSGIYLAEDTGGAIRNENGGKRVDVLIEGKSATAKFGRRNVQVAILERGSGPADARAKAAKWSSIVSKYKASVSQTSSSGSTKAQAVVSMGRSYIGKLRYVFGGKNIPGGTGDCSGYTYYIYKNAAGIDIGHGTSNQVTKGRSVAKSAAQAGDLIFFQNTYRKGVSHVGIVTRPGYFVNLASSGCYETSYLNGPYWPGKYHSIRRVL